MTAHAKVIFNRHEHSRRSATNAVGHHQIGLRDEERPVHRPQVLIQQLLSAACTTKPVIAI